jgi:hypothetical protein
MHWTTYSRLAKRYIQLQEVRDLAFCAEAYSMGMPIFAAGQADQLAAQASEEWRAVKRSKRKGDAV